MRFDQVIVISPAQRAIDALAEALPTLSRQKLKRAMDKGAVWLKKGKGQQRLRRATKVLQENQKLHIYYDDQILDQQAPTPELIADEKVYSIWDKPGGLLAQGTQYGDHCSLLRLAEGYFETPRPCFLIHRLDKDASGLMLIAHTAKAAAAFSQLFQTRQLTKRYRVGIEGHIDEPQIIGSNIDGKEAITHIEKIDLKDNNRCNVLIRIETGRKHQIRQHLASLGHPVIGDDIYSKSKTPDPLQLRAVELSFRCPLSNTDKQFELD